MDPDHHPRQGRRWQGRIERRGRVARLRSPELSSNYPDPHQLYFGADGGHAQLSRFRDGGVVRLRPQSDALDRPRIEFRPADGGADGAPQFRRHAVARHKSSDYIERFEKREDLQKVSPGQFKESASSNRIFFVEGAAVKNSAVQNVFVNTVDERGTAIVVAKEGVVNNAANGERFLVLKNGRRYQGTPGLADFQTMEFESYTMRVASQAQELGADLNVDALSTSALFADPNNFTRAEILWRIASPLTCLVLVLLAIPLGFVNPRAGSSANLIIALLIFFTYINLVKLLEASVKQGRLPFSVSWWPLHLLVALIVMGLFVWRLNVNHRYHPMVWLAARKRKQSSKDVAPL